MVLAFGAGLVVRSPAGGAHGRADQTAVPRGVDVKPVAELSQAFIAMAEAVTPAVVQIEAEHVRASSPHADVAPPLRQFFGIPPDDSTHADIPEIDDGTGIVVSGDGYIVTNNHVVAGADRITVTLYDKRAFPAQLVGEDPTTDIAVVRIAARGLTAARLGDSDRTRVGEWVLAVGNPGFGPSSTLDFTVTSGIISAKGRPLNVLNREMQSEDDPSASYAIEDFLQTDAVINPGNSGGPLVNLRGEVVGMNTAIASGTGYYQGYGFAIPANLVKRVMSDLIAYGEVRRPELGVSIRNVTAEDAEVYHLPRIAGALVQDFSAGQSPAQKAGLRRSDVIVSLDSVQVDRVGQLQRLVAQHHPGDVVRVGIIRFGEASRIPVRLAEAPIEHPAPRERAAPQPVKPTLGLDVGPLSSRLARHLGLAAGTGVFVTQVDPGSAADRANLFPGLRVLSIDGTQVSSVEEAQRELGRLTQNSVVSLLLQSPDGATIISNIRVP